MEISVKGKVISLVFIIGGAILGAISNGLIVNLISIVLVVSGMTITLPKLFKGANLKSIKFWIICILYILGTLCVVLSGMYSKMWVGILGAIAIVGGAVTGFITKESILKVKNLFTKRKDAK